MKRPYIILLLVIIGIIIFFFPKAIPTNCKGGPVCVIIDGLNEMRDLASCIGFRYENLSISDGGGSICYGLLWGK